MNFLSLSLICHSCNLIKGQSVLIFERECKGALAMLLTNRSGQQKVHIAHSMALHGCIFP